MKSIGEFLKTKSVADPNRGPIPFTGRSINEIRKYAVRKFLFLIKKGFCHMTIRHLMLPPNKANRNASNYHAVFKVKVPKKQNTVMGDHIDSHWARANARLQNEFRFKYRDSIGHLSVDDMNKVMVGASEMIPAVSRRHALRRFYPVGHAPNTKTHDFPKCFKIDVSGYMNIP